MSGCLNGSWHCSRSQYAPVDRPTRSPVGPSGYRACSPCFSALRWRPVSLLDVLLVDLDDLQTVDWDALGFGCREPFFTSTLKARKKKAKKQAARAA